MKGKVMSAFRERGLHLAVRDAEPQVSESISSMERKTDTMKTYILRDLKAVEPQKTARPARSQPALTLPLEPIGGATRGEMRTDAAEKNKETFKEKK